MALAKPAFETRPYQEECLAALKDAYGRGVRFALFVLATGLGKTYVAMQFLEWLVRELLGASPRRPRILVLCHQKPILRQLRKSFSDVLGSGYTYALYKPKQKEVTFPDVDILFATFQVMSRRRKLFDRKYFDVLLVDEGHHSMADSYAATVRYFRARFRYAMTATPNRLDLRDIRSLFGQEVYSKPLAAALAEELLPKVVYKYFLESRGRLASEAVKGRRASRRLLDRKFFAPRSSPERDQKIADEIVKEMGGLAHPRALVFCQTVAACDEMVGYLTARGVRAAAVHNKVADDDQEERLEALRAGEVQAVVSRDILNEGKDLPAVHLVAVVRSTASRTIFEQQIGRGLRPGKEQLTVLDFVANCDRIQQLADIVATVRATVRRRAAAGTGTEATDDEVESPAATLAEDTSDLPFAVEAGGVEFEVVYRDLLEVLGRLEWTVESGSAALRSLAASLAKKTLSSVDIAAGSKAGRSPGIDWTKKYLAPETGLLPEALLALGLEPSEWTAETGKKALRELAARLGKATLSTADIVAGSKARRCPSFTWVTATLAPTLPEALVAAGLDPAEWTAEKAKAAFVDLAKRLGKKTLNKEDMNEGRRTGQTPGYEWAAANLAPGPKPLPRIMAFLGLEPPSWTAETARAALLALAARLGGRVLRRPDVDAACAEGETPSLTWAQKPLSPGEPNLKGLNRVLGLGRHGWTVEQGVAALRTYAARLGKAKLSSTDVAAGCKERACPTWKWALKHAPELTTRG